MDSLYLPLEERKETEYFTLVERLRQVDDFSRKFAGKFLDVQGAQKALIDTECRSNVLLNRSVSNVGTHSYSIEDIFLESIDRLVANHNNPGFLEGDAFLKSRDLRTLVGPLPDPRFAPWYTPGSNLLFGLATGVATPLALYAIGKPNDILTFSGTVFAFTTAIAYAIQSTNKSENKSLINLAKDRLLPEAQYLDRRIIELYGGDKK